MPSLIDRLMATGGGAGTTAPTADTLRTALARDLEALLNTRATCALDATSEFPRASGSLLTFGLPDFDSLNLHGAPDRRRLTDEVRRAIERNEPRLARVQVSMVASPANGQPIRLRIAAELRSDARRRTPVSFDATLQLSSNAYRVKP
ncbi:type VI secretion system baseplate subunit TssE [Azoarcus olearius]|uniref:IraD/Gp25-like domain-containing protein n=1 Tax=Azoarcus sp. (strain BH72) TaxID=418699 RepID=A1K509_AZOSB|nr:type VI secretion system baseplate subunit TssE [Azoarcus olearius]CAL93914.1 conserved hypothetical protein [Azoarcus olearius]